MRIPLYLALGDNVIIHHFNTTCKPENMDTHASPSWLKRIATLPESGSARGFFLLKGSRSFPQSAQARSGRDIGLKTSFGAICWFP